MGFFFSFTCFPLAEWVGDSDSDAGGRLGLWQICQKDELNDSCSGKLEELLEMQSIAFQVSARADVPLILQLL